MGASSDPLPSLYIAHGGGPCFFMEWTFGPRDTYDRLAAWLRGLAATLPARPKAVVVISAHWEEPSITVTSGAAPPLIYDYYGFPEHTYRLTYPAPGEPALARQICALLDAAGIANRADPDRGFDHGVFIPFKLIYPDADVPIVAVSLREGLDPAHHIAVGHALSSLRRHGVLIVGSGASHHGPHGGGASVRFDEWLTETVCASDAAERNRALAQWMRAPYARSAHPREEHLLPLMVAAGAAGDDLGRRVFSDTIMNRAMSAFRFG